MKVGIDSLCAIIVAALNTVQEVRAALPIKNFWSVLGKLGAVWRILKNLYSIFKNLKPAVLEFRDLDDAEIATLGELVDYQLSAIGIKVQNIGELVRKALTAIDAVMDFVALIPKKSDDSTKA